MPALGTKDANAPIGSMQKDGVKEVKSMEYHRQMLKNKTAEQPSETFISPSDNIMSPCTAKINALRNKHQIKAKPKSLFAQASAKKLSISESSDNPLGAKSIQK